jgi:flagellar protein FlbD
VIILTRLGGYALAVNPDLIERAESTPDTVLTMIDGHKLVVAEPLDELVDLVRTWRASVAAQAFVLSNEPLSSVGSSAGSPALVSAPMVPAQSRSGDDDRIPHPALQTSMARVLRLPPRGE